MKKKVFGAITAIVMISHFSSAYALTTINEKIKEEQITSGVVLKNYDRFTEKGWLNINVLEVDLNDENTEVGLLNSENGLNTFQTVYQMANKDNIVAAINGDFFNGTSVNGNTITDSIIIFNKTDDKGHSLDSKQLFSSALQEVLISHNIVYQPHANTHSISHS